jgi:shikimate dehydrogenase
VSKSFAEVIGDPIAHSKSPLIHNFWLERLNLSERFDYSRRHVKPADLASYLTDRRPDQSWLGCNVTIPHKQAVIPLIDKLDPAAQAIGAVNTIVREGDLLVGYNSDAPGFLEPLRPLLARPSLFRMARIVGSGGAAKAIVHALAAEGFELVLIARDTAKARALLDEEDPWAHHVAPLASFAEHTDFAWTDRSGVLDLFVNATSLGMKGEPPLLVDFSHVPPGAIVYDIVYAPLETPLLREARAHGHKAIDGLEMLVGQAAVAFEKFFGAPAPRQYDAGLRENLVG